MKLFNVQDSDRPMWVAASNWLEAIEKWKAKIRQENDGECGEPEGVQLVCDEDDLLIDVEGFFFEQHSTR